MAETAAEIRKSVKIYLTVFVALAFLTVVTVAVSYLHLPFVAGIALAMFIAGIKGFLVAGFFMHLLDERKTIYWILALTVFFFVVLMVLPAVDQNFGWDQAPRVEFPAAHDASHASHGGEGDSH